MANGKELKPKSFRIDDETANKFKEISASLGDGINKANQQETLAKLIEAYEFQAGKIILAEKKADIEQFEKYVSVLTHMYMRCLEDNQSITETVRTEFAASLNSKETIIRNLQEQLSAAKQDREKAMDEAKIYKEESARYKRTLEEKEKESDLHIKNLQDMLSDKDNLNKVLTDTCNELKEKIDISKQEHEELLTIKENLDSLRSEYRELSENSEKQKKSIEELKEKIDISKQEHEELLTVKENLDSLRSEYRELSENSEKQKKSIEELKQHEINALEQSNKQAKIELDKAVFQTEKIYMEQIQKLKEEKQEEIDKYQKKYFDLLEKMQQ